MSFQSFSKIPPPPKHRAKNLPTLEFISLLNLLCEQTINEYDPRNHILSIYNMESFRKALREKANRSFESFEKQLRILGFKKQREHNQEGAEVRVGIKYYWRGRREEFLKKELTYSEKQLNEVIAKVTNFRDNLVDKKNKLDKNFENTLFWGLINGPKDPRSQQKVKETIHAATESINWAHKNSGEVVKEIKKGLEDEISILRMLTFRHSEFSEQQ